jgi:hypothetical protein
MSLKKITVITLLVVTLLPGCARFSSGNCSRIIERNKMITILTDVFMLEAYMAQNQSTFGVRDSTAYYYSGVFLKHNITSDQFDAAFKCYMMDENNISPIMDEVLSSVSILQSRMQEKKQNETPATDYEDIQHDKSGRYSDGI